MASCGQGFMGKVASVLGPSQKVTGSSAALAPYTLCAGDCSSSPIRYCTSPTAATDKGLLHFYPTLPTYGTYLHTGCPKANSFYIVIRTVRLPLPCHACSIPTPPYYSTYKYIIPTIPIRRGTSNSTYIAHRRLTSPHLISAHAPGSRWH